MNTQTQETRVFTETFPAPGLQEEFHTADVLDKMTDARLKLLKRAEKLGLNPEKDGINACNYHPSSGKYVVILTITPTEEPKCPAPHVLSSTGTSLESEQKKARDTP